MDLSLDQNKIKQILESERDALLEGVVEPSAESGLNLPANPDHGDLARNYDARQRRLYLDSLAQEKLDLIERALQRLDNGTYGKCVKCGKDIHPERLKALPYAEKCVACQAKQEKRF
jgi:DnaK suppressor protein